MWGMRKRNLLFLPILSCLMFGPAVADWQYPGMYVGDGWYEDDGSRFVISARGGAAFGMGTVKNEVGGIQNKYYIDLDTGSVITEFYYGQCYDDGGCLDYVVAGYADLGDVSPRKDFKGFSFAAGASIGWTIPNKPQWRIEAGWDHISESEYNSSPFLEGYIELFGGDVDGVAIDATSASVQSKVSTDVISAMVFYDFFDGIQKPTRTMIPYVGFGVGYADTKTILNLADTYGDLSAQPELFPYGEAIDSSGLLRFYKSEYSTSNVAGVAAVGASYGISENMFVDFGLRAMYLPRVKWELSNEDGSKHREFFSVEDLFYVNAMLGLRFEF